MQTLESLKTQLERSSAQRLRRRSTLREIKIVAEGDSWFAYPLVLDVIDHLRRMKYCVYKHSEPGDTLENMVFGSEFKMIRRLNNARHLGPLDLQETLNSVRKYKPRFALFSAGGNDVVGQEMGFYLNHKNSGQPLIRKKRYRYFNGWL